MPVFGIWPLGNYATMTCQRPSNFNYLHSMTCHTQGIRATAPVKWRGMDGMVGVFWEAECQSGATGYYMSPDPRIMIFFDDISSYFRMANRAGEAQSQYRSMTRAIYVPAGTPMWTNSTSERRFSHLDLHIHSDRMLKFLSPAVGSSAARSAMLRPIEIQDVAAIEPLADLVVSEVSTPLKHAIYAESLVGGIVAGLLDIPGHDTERSTSKLTRAQMDHLTLASDARGDGRMNVAEMAAVVGLSENWFSKVFRATTGQTPSQWQQTRRIDMAKTLLLESQMTVADISARLGFTDQAHLTKAFRQVTGATPAAWRRMQQIL